jgi:hypothetical protein
VAFAAGDTFYLLRGTGPQPHLWVLLWGPAGAADAFLAVHLTSLRPYSDRTCVLAAGEHPFVRHDTVAQYRDVRRIVRSELEAAIARREAFVRERASPALLERLREGMFRSPFTTNAMLHIARAEFAAAPARTELIDPPGRP